MPDRDRGQGRRDTLHDRIVYGDELDAIALRRAGDPQPHRRQPRRRERNTRNRPSVDDTDAVERHHPGRGYVHAVLSEQQGSDYWCWDPAKLGEDQLFDHYASADAERLDPLAIWHRVQLHRSCAPNQLDCIDGADGDPVARDGFFTMDYGPARRRYIWEYTDDNTFWLATSSHAPTIPANPNSACEPANDNLYGAGTCLDGRLWTHGVTPVGNTCDRAPPDESCGLINAPPGATVGFHGEQLANHFFDSAPDAPWYHTNGGMQARPIFFIRMTLPDPWPVWRFASGTAVPLVNEDGQLNAFFESGRREDVDGVVSHDARIALYDTTLNWLSAVEASPSAGNPWRPVGIALKSGVGDIEAYQSLVDDGAGTIDLGGAPQIVSGPDGAPRPRTGYGAAYSRSRGRIFVVGGLDVETGEPYQDVWKLDFDVGYWQLVPRAPQVLTTILAVTYSYRDGMLWIVDRDERDPSAAATRLVRLDPTTGSSEVLHITQPGSDHAYDELTLGVDLDGNVILTASKNYPQRHRIAVISPRAGGYDVAMTRCRQRALVTPALADLHGYALFYQQDNLPDTTCVDEPQAAREVPSERLDALPLRTATLDDLEDVLYRCAGSCFSPWASRPSSRHSWPAAATATATHRMKRGTGAPTREARAHPPTRHPPTLPSIMRRRTTPTAGSGSPSIPTWTADFTQRRARRRCLRRFSGRIAIRR